MSREARTELLQTMSYHYQRAAGKRQRGALLDQLVRCTGWERKYAIKMLLGQRGPLARAAGPCRGPGGSKPRYGPAEIAVLKALWLLAEQPCGKRLKAVVALWLPSWERQHGVLAAPTRQKLLAMSASQMDRLLRPFRVAGKPRRPAPGCEVRAQVPLRTGEWQVDQAGWLEADTVAHCGTSMKGCFAWSVVLTDIYSQWTEARATWNRSDRVVHERFEQVEAALPFGILGMDSDNGGEFLNHTLWRYWRQRERPVEVTRSRPYRKNDNAHVEQKNLTHIRQFIGYERLEHEALVQPLDEVLQLWSLWNNLYSPTLKLVGKQREGSRVRKVYEKSARTPCQRLLECERCEPATRARVQHLLHSTDPIELKGQIEAKLRAFWQHARALQEEARVMPPTSEATRIIKQSKVLSPLGGNRLHHPKINPKPTTPLVS